jgi:hypothetical protein
VRADRWAARNLWARRTLRLQTNKIFPAGKAVFPNTPAKIDPSGPPQGHPILSSIDLALVLWRGILLSGPHVDRGGGVLSAGTQQREETGPHRWAARGIAAHRNGSDFPWLSALFLPGFC